MIQRPGSREGDDMGNTRVARQSIKNTRSGIGNYTIIRPGAKRTSGFGRSVAFSRLSVIDSENAGVVELGEKTLSKLFDVQVPDNRDITWIAEKARLLAKYQAEGMTRSEAEREIKINKPLGRAQRTITKKRNIAESNLSVSNKIAELKEEVDQGRAESRADQAMLVRELSRIFGSIRSMQTISSAEFNNLRRISERVNIPSSRTILGLNARYVDKDYYDSNSGSIHLLLIGKLIEAEKKGVDYDKYNMNLIVRDYSKGIKGIHDGLPAKSISSMYSALSRGFPRDPRYLDLDSGGLISQEQLRTLAGYYPGGFANPIFSIADTKLTPITKPGTSAASSTSKPSVQ
jgi:DNA-binding protein H-NS